MRNLVALAAIVLAPAVAPASGTLCFADFLAADCADWAEDSPVSQATRFKVSCVDEFGAVPPSANQLVVMDAEGERVNVQLLSIDACGDDVFELSACIAPGDYVINHGNDSGGSGGTSFTFACNGGAEEDGGSGCRQVPGASPLWLALLLLGAPRRFRGARSRS